jgi:hypothetical protein
MSQQNRRSKRKAPASQPNIGLMRVFIALGSMVALALAAILVWSIAGGANSRNTSEATSIIPAVTGAPRLKSDRDIIEIGDVKLGQTVQAVFELTNVGDQPLRVSDDPYIEVVEGC